MSSATSEVEYLSETSVFTVASEFAVKATLWDLGALGYNTFEQA